MLQVVGKSAATQDALVSPSLSSRQARFSETDGTGSDGGAAFLHLLRRRRPI